MISIFILALIVVYVSYVLWQRYQYFHLRERIGLKGPEANLIFGNMLYFMNRTKELGYDDGYNKIGEWAQEYGETFGMYMGGYLQIVTTNEEFIKEVFIKQFSNFVDRCVPGIFDQNGLNQSLVQMGRDAGWKEVRSCMSPQFSTGKIRMMHETVKDKIEIFMKNMQQHAKKGDTFDIYDDFQVLTMDVIGKCAFAIESNCQENRDEIFYRRAKEMFRQVDIKESVLVPLSVFFPEFSWILKWFYPVSGMAAAERPLLEGLGRVYDMRKEGMHTNSVDILQLLLNKEELAGSTMTRRQVIENCFAFLLAGYETTSTALGYCAYALAKHPEVQQKLYNEIKETKETKGLNFDSIHAMKYLDAVFKEVLRVYPPVINFTSRQCVNDTVVCGQVVPKGTWVFLSPYAMHHNEKFWPEHDKFIPERMLDFNDKNSARFCPFGLGPRFCVGMRFAEMEFKMTIVKLLDKYSISIPKDVEEMIPTVLGVILQPKDGIKVKITER